MTIQLLSNLPAAKAMVTLSSVASDLTPLDLSRLPLELEFVILGWLEEDKPSCASGSLVQKRWRPILQSLLFRTIRISIYSPNKTSSGVDLHRMARFFRFIQTHAHIAVYIHRLFFLGHNDAPITLSALHSYVEQLSQLHTLVLKGLQLQFDIDPSISPGCTSIYMRHPKPSLKELSIVDCDSYRSIMTVVLSIICAFSEIGVLRIYGVHEEDTLTKGFILTNGATLAHSELYEEHGPIIRNLCVHDLLGSFLSAIHSMVLRNSSHKHGLTSLDVRVISMDAMFVISRLVRDVGRHLRKLELMLRCFGGMDITVNGFCNLLDLSSCTALQTLKLHLWACDQEISFRRRAAMSWLPTCLAASAELLANHKHALLALKTVRIIIDADGVGTLAMRALQGAAQAVNTGWQPLDAALMDIDTLTCIEVFVQNDWQQITAEQSIVLRKLVEVSLSGLLASHGDNLNDFFRFVCPTTC